MSLSLSGLGQLAFSAAAAGGGIVLAVASALGELPIPKPDSHTPIDLLMAGIGAYIARELHAGRKKAVNATGTETKSGEFKSLPDLLLSKLEDLAYGVKENSTEMRDHREEFREFRGEIRARVDGIENRVERLES